MRISFDLDDTLICHGHGCRHEPLPPWYRRLLVLREPLRLGAGNLLRSLRADGCELWIYTTSHRRPRSVRRWLRSYGVNVDGVINQDIHDRRLRQIPRSDRPSKNPRAFGIDLHIDDSEGVRLEGERHGFQVVVVDPNDLNWAEKVFAAATQISGACEPSNFRR